MKNRPEWAARIEAAWKRLPVVWLSGVRRVGKTTLCRSLPEIEYFDCELPRVRRMLEDPEAFLEDHDGSRIVLDEIHRLDRPAELLKIVADHFPRVRVVATGSSTLGASAKFKDTLTGRKSEIWLTPMTLADMEAFANRRMAHRLLRGGLPPFFLADELPRREFQEWVDAFWAKDVQELFRVERRASFMKFFEMLLAGSGGMFEATRYAKACEVSRTTIGNYLSILEATFVVHVIRPFTTRKPTEVVAAPKTYGFDTGFVAHWKGWEELRAEDLGVLWEHFVLNELHAALGSRTVQYWRDKQGHEVDFVLAIRRATPIAIECKWKAKEFDPRNIAAFRGRYPKGRNFVVASDVNRPFRKRFGDLDVEFVHVEAFASGAGFEP